MQLLYGEEARRYAKEEKTVCMDGLLKKALASESVESEGTLYEAADLLFLFLKKLLTRPPQNGEEPLPEKIVITTENMNLPKAVRIVCRAHGDFVGVSAAA